MDRVQSPEQRVERLDRRIYLLAFAIFATGTDAGVVAGMLPQIARGFQPHLWYCPSGVNQQDLTKADCLVIWIAF